MLRLRAPLGTCTLVLYLAISPVKAIKWLPPRCGEAIHEARYGAKIYAGRETPTTSAVNKLFIRSWPTIELYLVQDYADIERVTPVSYCEARGVGRERWYWIKAHILYNQQTNNGTGERETFVHMELREAVGEKPLLVKVRRMEAEDSQLL